MISEQLPRFPYHPDPVATGSVVATPVVCACCGQQRSFTYAGPVFAQEELADRLCPWCIADGSAAAAYGAQFTDAPWRVPEDVTAEATDVVLHRTPGFIGWQQEQWMHHCPDGAEFHGRVGAEELAALPGAVQTLRDDFASYGWTAEDFDKFLQRLSPDGEATAYLFRCRHCRSYLAYADFL
jgi:uncharacterized protein CbrC (UPF0167 family)